MSRLNTLDDASNYCTIFETNKYTCVGCRWLTRAGEGCTLPTIAVTNYPKCEFIENIVNQLREADVTITNLIKPPDQFE